MAWRVRALCVCEPCGRMAWRVRALCVCEPRGATIAVVAGSAPASHTHSAAPSAQLVHCVSCGAVSEKRARHALGDDHRDAHSAAPSARREEGTTCDVAAPERHQWHEKRAGLGSGSVCTVREPWLGSWSLGECAAWCETWLGSWSLGVRARCEPWLRTTSRGAVLTSIQAYMYASLQHTPRTPIGSQ
jgi:hypothetical protein